MSKEEDLREDVIDETFEMEHEDIEVPVITKSQKNIILLGFLLWLIAATIMWIFGGLFFKVAVILVTFIMLVGAVKVFKNLEVFDTLRARFSWFNKI